MQRGAKAKTIISLTKQIRAYWSKSVENLIRVGKCLHHLRGLLERDEYLKHLSNQFSMSEMQANRLERLYLHFNTKASIHVLSARPSVLYILMSSVDPKKIDSLAKGGKIKIGKKMKSLEELTVKDVSAIGSKKPRNPFDQDDNKVDAHKAENAHRHLATLVEEVSNWAEDLTRFQKQGLEVHNRPLIKRYIQETIECLRELNKLL